MIYIISINFKYIPVYHAGIWLVIIIIMGERSSSIVVTGEICERTWTVRICKLAGTWPESRVTGEGGHENANYVAQWTSAYYGGILFTLCGNRVTSKAFRFYARISDPIFLRVWIDFTYPLSTRDVYSRFSVTSTIMKSLNDLDKAL